MEPEEDFQNWSMIITQCVEAGGDYQYLVDGYCRLADQILNNSKLQGDLEDFTSMFLTETVPEATNKILNLHYVYPQELAADKKVLISSSLLAAWSFSNDNFDLLDSLKAVFDSKSSIYLKNWINYTESAMESVIAGFISSGGVVMMKSRFKKDGITIDHFSKFLQLLTIDTKSIKTLRAESKDIVIQFLDFLDNNEIENQMLNQTCINALTVTLSLKEPEDVLSRFLLYSEKLVRNDKVNFQIIGATLLSKICQSTKKAIKDCYQKWKETTTLGDFLSDQDLNPKLIEVIEPVYVSILNPKSLAKLWKDAIVAHSSQRASMFGIVAKALKEFKLEESKSFIDEAINEPNDESVNFLVKTFESSQTNDEFALYVLRKVIDIKGTGSKIAETIKYATPGAFKKKVVNECLEKLSTEAVDNALIIMKHVASITYDVYDVFPKDFPKLLIKMTNENKIKKDVAMSLFVTVMQKSNVSINQETIETLSEMGEDDSLWNFFSEAIEKSGTSAIDENAYPKLFEILEKQDKVNASIAYARIVFDAVFYNGFIKEFIQNQYCSSSKFITKNYIINSFPLEHNDIIEDLMMHCANQNVSEYATRALLIIVMNSLDTVVPMKNAVSLFLSAKTDLEKLRTISFLHLIIKSLCMHYRISDFGITSHKESSHASEVKIIIRCEGEDKEIYINPESTPEFLRARLSFIYSCEEGSIKMETADKYDLTSYYKLDKLKEGDVITVRKTKKSDFHPPNVFSVIIDSDICELIAPLLESESIELQEMAYDFLCNFPDAKNVIELAKDPAAFVEKLKDTTEMNFKYMLEVVVKIVKKDAEYASKFMDQAAGLLFSRINKQETKLLVLDIINIGFNDNCKQYMEKSIPILLNNFATVISAKRSISIIGKFMDIEPRTADIVFEHKDLLIKAINVSPTAVWVVLKTCLSKFPQKPIFELCLEKIGSPETKKDNYIELFSEAVGKLSDEVDLAPILSKCVSLLKEATLSTLSGLCSAINSMLLERQSEIPKYQYLTNELISTALNTDNDEAQETIFKLCVTLGIKDWSPLKEACNINTDNFNINPSFGRKSSTGFAGLRNLGATCYMNSVIQQLYNIPAFLANVIGAKLEKEGQFELQELLTAMRYTKKRAADTQPFVSKWLGWGKQLVNPKEQQDALEFFQLILDQMPNECNKFFKGSIRNIMKGATVEYESHNSEDFYSVPLEVKGCKNLQDSFKVFTQSEQFEDYKAEGIDHPIDILKYARIEKAPPILVLQLKRFEYDFQTFNKIKINDRFEFTDKIDISPLMCDSDKPVLYKLIGVVNHRGTAQGGHYTSLIKVNKKWVLFNDQEVSDFQKSDLQTETFGGSNAQDEYDAGPSAYLLFYSSVDFDAKPEVHFNEEIVKKIKEENTKFVQSQAVFSKTFFNYATLADDPLPYMINIFAHSALSENSQKMKSIINNFLEDGGKEHINYAADYFIKEFDKVKSIFINCSDNQIISCVSGPIMRVMKDADVEKSKTLCTMFIDSLPQVLQIRKQVPFVCSLIHEFVKAHLAEAEEMKVDEKINEFIATIYSTSRSTMYYQSINIAPLFASLMLFEEFDTTIIQQYVNQIILSGDNNTEFLKLYTKLSEEGKVDIAELLGSLHTSKKVEDKDAAIAIMCEVILANVSNAKTVFDLATKKKELYKLLELLNMKVKSMDKNALELFRSNPNLIVDALTTTEDCVNHIAEKLLFNLFPFITSPKKKNQESSSTVYDTNASLDKANVIKHELADDEEKSLMLEFFDSIRLKINAATKSPALFYKTLTIEQSEGESSFYLISLLKCYSWALGALNMKSDASEYERIQNLTTSLKSLNLENDMNLMAAVNCLLSFDECLYEKDFVALTSSLLVSNKKPRNVVEDYRIFFNKLSSLPDQSKIEFFSSDAAEFVANNLIQTSYISNDSLISVSAEMCCNLGSKSALRFLYALFSKDLSKRFKFTANVMTNVFITVMKKLNDECVANYTEAFLSLITMRAKRPTTIKSSNFKFCVKACGALCHEIRWFGKVDVSDVVLYPEVIAKMEQTEACIPMAMFVEKCIPLLDIDALYDNCIKHYETTTTPEALSGLLCLILKCILLSKGDDEEGIVAKLFDKLEDPMVFVVFASSLIASGTKWHVPIAVQLINESFIDYSKVFVVASRAATKDGTNFFDKLKKDSVCYKEWYSFLNDVSATQDDTFHVNAIDFDDSSDTEVNFDGKYSAAFNFPSNMYKAD